MWVTNILPEIGRRVEIRFREDQLRFGRRDNAESFRAREGYDPPIVGLPHEWWSLTDEKGEFKRQIVAIDQALGWR